jgi:hypothetical protein
MDPLSIFLWGLAILGGLAALYGLHRLCLWLERHGWLYYKHKNPSSSAASCFVALQQVLEPPVKHVFEMKQERRTHAEGETPGTVGRRKSKQSTINLNLKPKRS